MPERLMGIAPWPEQGEPERAETGKEYGYDSRTQAVKLYPSFEHTVVEAVTHPWQDGE
jgi:hypothetical protein